MTARRTGGSGPSARALTLRARAALLAAWAAGRASRLLGRGGGHALPGRVADLLDPLLLPRLAERLAGGVVLVTGTNGKTTTTRLIVAGLTAAGHTVVTNPTGSNLRQGILSSLITSSDLRGRLDGTIGVFEVDEVSLPRVAAETRPRLAVVLNIFRDQLDRHADLETVAARVSDGLRLVEGPVLLNADDPLVADLARRSKVAAEYFGIDASVGDGGPVAADGYTDADRCPVCGRTLTYSRVFFAQLGHYACPSGDFSRPAPTVTLISSGAPTSTGTPFVMRAAGALQAARTASPGTYSLYNSLAALAACSMLGADLEAAAAAVSSTTPAFGRSEQIDILGRQIRLVLVKNPTGCAQVIDTFLVGDADAPLLLGLNDAAADGRDVSWIWDTPFESLAGRTGAVVVCGTRADDLSLRLRYADVEAHARPTVGAAVDDLLASVPEGGHGYVLGSYTAMLDLRRHLLDRSARPGVAA